mgnify:CR=1 FL=1
MFKDYYKILGISQNATQEEIKTAYHSMSLKWHPDMNPNRDTTEIMQDINEAYAILRDTEAKRRYDIEYKSFNEQFEHAGKDYFKTDSNFGTEEESESENESESESESEDETAKNHEEYQSNQQSSWTYDYEVHDENLKNDIKSARNYAKEFVAELHRTSKAVAKGAWSNIKTGIYFVIILSVVVFLIQLCSNAF